MSQIGKSHEGYRQAQSGVVCGEPTTHSGSFGYGLDRWFCITGRNMGGWSLTGDFTLL